MKQLSKSFLFGAILFAIAGPPAFGIDTPQSNFAADQEESSTSTSPVAPPNTEDTSEIEEGTNNNILQSNSEIGVNITNELGERIWVGEEPAELIEAELRIGDVIANYPENFSGFALTSDRQILEVYLINTDGPGVSELWTAAGSAKERITLIQNNFSALDMEAAQNAVVELDWENLSISSVGSNPIDDTLIIRIDPANSERQRMPTEDTISADINSVTNVPFTIETESPQEGSGRGNDVPYYYAGGKITRGSIGCSLGAPLSVGGKFYTVTAGHCHNGDWYNGNGSNFVGSTYTTSWNDTPSKATTKAYGDFQLLKGSNYALRVFSDSLTSNVSLPISNANFSTRSIGSELCSSGGYTGSTCRYVVKGVNESVGVNIRGVNGNWTTVPVGKITRTIHDTNRDGIADCQGTTSGDSGGLSYYADGKGGVIAYGTITSHSNPSSCRDKTYSISQLSGIKAWNSSTKLG